MDLKCGLIGLPNVGKSSLFNALTNLKVPSENFPFCTINSNLGIVPIYDIRLKILSKIVHSKKIVPNNMHFVDIAGLVKGAHNGEGLGNKFLQDIKNVDVLIHVVRCFLQPSIIHVNGNINPIRDIKLINNELIISDYITCEKKILELNKKNINKDVKRIRLVLNDCLKHLDQGKLLNSINLNKYDLEIIKKFCLITFKPMMYVINIDNINNEYLNKVCNYLKLKKHEVIILNVLSKKNTVYKKNMSKDLFFDNLKNYNDKLNKIVFMLFNLLKLQTFFTVGIKEVRGWTIRKETTAFEASKKIHTDIQKGFIRAKIISYEDFVKYNGEKKAKSKGKCRTEGKEYRIKDGDIVHFLFNI